MEVECLPDREANLQLHRLCAPNGRIWSRRSFYWPSRSRLRFLLLTRTPLLLPSMSLVALAISAIVALAARRRYYPVGCLGRVCVHRVCSRDAQRSSTSAGVLIRVSGASSIIASDQFAQQTGARISIGSQTFRSCSISFQTRSQHSFKSS